MKLNKKFSLLVAWIGIQTILLAGLLIVMFNRVIGLKTYQRELSRAQYMYGALTAFTDEVNARGVDMDTMVEEWTTHLNNTKTEFDLIIHSSTRKSMNQDMNDMVDDIETLWAALENQIEPLTDVYTKLAAVPVSSIFKNSVSQSGFLNAIDMYRSTEPVDEIDFELRSAKLHLSTIYYAQTNFTDLVTQLSDSVSALVDRQTRISNTLMIVLTILSALIMGIVIRINTHSVTKRISEIRKMTEDLSEKDFTVSTKISSKNKDEVSDLQSDLNKTVSHLNDVFVNVKKSARIAQNFGQSINGSAEETAAATHEINSNIESMTKQFDTLSQAVDKSIASITQMNQVSTVLVQDNTIQSKSISESNNAVTEMSNTLADVSKMAAAKTKSAQEMQQLVTDGDSKINATNSLLQEITGMLDEVSDIVTIINAIAEQTNLLSMNAAIESAHAGDAGKGFGVVAEEIRTLAESTGENSKRITDSIYTIIDKVKEANETSGDASKAFAKVSESAHDMLSSFHDISENISMLDERTKKVAEKTSDIASSSDKINGYCAKLTEQQNVVSSQMNSMNQIFTEALSGISEIKLGTEDIVKRMLNVSDKSSESCKQMAKLESDLLAFKTNDVSLPDVTSDADSDSVPDALPAEQESAEAAADTEAPEEPKTESHEAPEHSAD